MEEIQSMKISSAEKTDTLALVHSFCVAIRRHRNKAILRYSGYIFSRHSRMILSVSSLFRLLFMWKNRLDSSDFRVHILLLHGCFPNLTCTNLMPKSGSSINILSLNFMKCQAGAFQKNIIRNISWKGFSLVSLQVFDLCLCLCQLEHDPWPSS